ncbi:glutamate 5-kinase [Dehalobacter sp. DCM]|uniref:glutamate 5-kinase n=1 Tax=Dehalobacter sp. DCM TaxID=2907827 RepID=UPI00308165FD|nr:glutamate 5-kinase [Dehalobacter sp. DCM]
MNTLKRAVIKIGSNSLSQPQGGINEQIIDQLAEVIAELRVQGIDVILVSSGAVAAGMAKMKLKERPRDIVGKQATAAVGQGILIERYSYYFDKHGLSCAQILLSRIDLVEAGHYRNARNTLEKLLNYGIVPIVNENDTVVFEELCFGDNDRLSALVAGMINADLLILMTDVDGLYTANPATHPDAVLIRHVDDVSKVKGLADGAGSAVGTGGMVTKLKAAEMATRFGTATFLMNASRMKEISGMIKDACPLGTYFPQAKHKMNSKKRWIAYAALSNGTIIIDSGAEKALLRDGKSLLASGVTGAQGFWERKDLVKIVNAQGEEVARGIIELSSEETDRVKGLHSEEILKLIPDLKAEELVHRDNLTVTLEC